MREGTRATPAGAGRSRRVRSLGVFAVAAALAPIAVPSTAAGDTDPVSVAVTGRCTATTEAGQLAFNSIGLGGFGINAAVSLPEQTPVGDPAVVDVALSYDLPEAVASAAGSFDIDTVDIGGTAFEVTLQTPAGPLTATATPPASVVDAGTAATIDLGAVHFDLPTDDPGAVQVVIDPATVTFAASPADFAGTGTCEAHPASDMPVGFIVDPLAPVIDPALRTTSVTQLAGTADLGPDVTAGPGPVLDDSWRVVRTAGTGTATIDDAGVATYELTGAQMEAVWEVCGLSAPPATATSLPDGGSADEGSDPVDSDSAADSDGAVDSGEADQATRHCAQGVLRVSDGNEPVTQVESSSVEVSSGQQPAATAAAPVPAAAPISVTG